MSQDFRNYKVSIEKARKVLSFHPKHDVESIIKDLVENLAQVQGLRQPRLLQYPGLQDPGKEG